MACAELGVVPDACVYVGDGSSRELAGARRLGMRPVLFEVPLEERSSGLTTEADGWTGERVRRLMDVVVYVNCRRAAPVATERA